MTPKYKKALRQVVGENPELEWLAPLLLYKNEHHKLDYLATLLNAATPGDNSVYDELIKILEDLIAKPLSKEHWQGIGPLVALERLGGESRCFPTPGSPLDRFNKIAMWYPNILRIEGHQDGKGNIKALATHMPISVLALMTQNSAFEVDRGTAGLVWFIWEIFSDNIDVGRLKKCSVCNKWFADHTKNKAKIRCSKRCTWQYWSWDQRKKANHDQSGGKKKDSQKTKGH